MATLTCARDGVTDLQVFDKGLLVDPAGWSTISIVSLPAQTARLCPHCTNALRTFLDNESVYSAAEIASMDQYASDSEGEL